MTQWAESTVQDLRFALRSWSRSPAFTLAAIATLAIGIGANTAIFSVISGVLLRPLPFVEPQNLVQVYETQPRSSKGVGFDGSVIYGDFDQWRTSSRLLDGIATYIDSARILQGLGEPQLVSSVSAEPQLFPLLGIPPVLGRTFTAADPPEVAVISYAFWQEVLNADRAALGREITLDTQSFRVIGVMPADFQIPYGPSVRRVWMPWTAAARLRPTSRMDSVIVRLKPGVSLEAARQEFSAMDSVARGGRIVRIKALRDVVTGAARDSLLILLGAVGMVLLVACVNVANLLLARTASRAREIAVRSAIGAGRARLIRQFLTESLLLAFAGGAAGLCLGILGRQLLLNLAASQIPRAQEIGLDWRVFAFLLGVCLVTGIGFGLAPAIAAGRSVAPKLARRHLGATLRDSLVVLEVALAFLLLTGAGLLLRTFLNLQRTSPGLNPESVITMHVTLADGGESLAVSDRVTQIPGVRAAGMISLLPLQDSNWSGGFTIPGRPGMYESELRYITPGYFRAMGVPLRRGREFTAHDDRNSPTAIIVNETLARISFPNEDPIGRKTDRGIIIGVVGDVRQAALNIPSKAEIYYSVAQNFAQIRRLGSTLVVRSDQSPETLVSAIRAVVRDVNPGQALFHVTPMRDVIQGSLASPRLYAWLVGIFAAIGTLLAIAGVYGVIAYLVALQTREFGVRMALGADAAGIVMLVMRHGAWLAALGLVLGATGAAALTRVMRGLLYGVGSTDAFTFVAVSAILASVAVAACVIPARRASRVNPAIALRCE